MNKAIDTLLLKGKHNFREKKLKKANKCKDPHKLKEQIGTL